MIYSKAIGNKNHFFLKKMLGRNIIFITVFSDTSIPILSVCHGAMVLRGCGSPPTAWSAYLSLGIGTSHDGSSLMASSLSSIHISMTLYSFHVAATCASCMYEKGWNQPSWVDLASFYNETYLISCPSPSLSRPTTDQLVERSHLNTALLVSCWIYIVYVWKESVPIGHLTAEPTNGSGAIMIWLHYSEQFITLFICPIYAGTVHTVARSGHSVFSGQFFRFFFKFGLWIIKTKVLPENQIIDSSGNRTLGSVFGFFPNKLSKVF